MRRNCVPQPFLNNVFWVIDLQEEWIDIVSDADGDIVNRARGLDVTNNFLTSMFLSHCNYQHESSAVVGRRLFPAWSLQKKGLSSNYLVSQLKKSKNVENIFFLKFERTQYFFISKNMKILRKKYINFL